MPRFARPLGCVVLIGGLLLAVNPALADDCNSNGIDDAADIAGGTSEDCNSNAVPDECDIAGGTSYDSNANQVPDECDPDCNTNGFPDFLDIHYGFSADCNENGIPDECDLADCPPDDLTCADCNGNQVPDECEEDCNTNGVPDECDLWAIRTYDAALGTLPDAQGFTRVDTGDPSPEPAIVDDALHQGPTAEQGSQYYHINDVRLDFTVGFELEADLQVVSSDYANCYGRPVAGYCIWVTDDAQRLFYIWIGEDRIIVQNSNEDLSAGSSYATAGPYRHYRFVVEEGIGTLFIDDEPFISVEVGAESQAADPNKVHFGDITGCAGSDTYLENLFFRSPTDPGGGYSSDCNLNGVPDECEPADDCNSNGAQDFCDIAAGTSQDCNTNEIPDDCELLGNDCNTNGIPDDCELAGNDCNTNGIPDDCELAGNDCNANGVPDECDIATNGSSDCNANGVPDECEPDCNTNGVADECDITAGTSDDIDGNGVPDECDPDCNTNGIIDGCDVSCAGGCAGVPGCGASTDCLPDGVPDECQPDCNSNGTADCCDIAGATSWDCNSNGVPDECDLGAGTSGDCNTNSVPDECDIAAGTSLDVNGDDLPDECEAIVFVDADAAGTNNGTSWANAFNDLQDALAVASTNGLPTQVWVAAGIYRPDCMPDPCTGTSGARTATFQLLEQVRLYGGFVGGELSLDERDPAVNETFLSGDLNANDGPDFSSNGENGHHVVTGSGVDATAVLDGFHIVGGNGDGTYGLYDRGAALYCDAGHPTVYNCVFSANYAQYGAVYLIESSPSFMECVFVDNSAQLGGALCSELDADPTLTNCSFRGNTADQGGAMFSSGDGRPDLVNCFFVGNSATQYGGGIYVTNSAPTLTNCTLSANTAVFDGGGVYVAANDEAALLSNCILWSNEDSGGTDESAQLYVVGDAAEVDYSCVQGGWTGPGGTGNIASDPSFVDAEGPDGVCGTEDDNLRLSAGSPAIDAGTNGLVTVETDLDGKARLYDDPLTPDTGSGTAPIVDLGAYEFQADCNGNGVPDDLDIAAGTSRDCNSNALPDECEPDCNSNGVADECDVTEATSTDCNSNGVPDECEPDCNANGVADECDITEATSADCNTNGVPDECETDCNTNGIADECDLWVGTSADCNSNAIPDECDIAQATAADCDADGTPDSCQADSDGDGVIDACDNCPATPPGEEVDEFGCPYTGACCFGLGVCYDNTTMTDCAAFEGTYQGKGTTCDDDADGDGTPDCFEECPYDLNKTEPGICGCGVPDEEDDTDADGVWDCVDLCPDTPEGEDVDSNGCAFFGACCSAMRSCLDGNDAAACAGIGGVFQGNQSSCADGCAYGTWGDFDGDADVDAADYAWFESCLSGPVRAAGYVPPSPQCRTVFDFDGDHDVDLFDFAAFTTVFGP